MDVAEKLAKFFLSRALARLKDAGHTDNDHLGDHIQQHLLDVKSWSEHIQFLGMAIPHDTDSVTIPLPFDFGNRRFQDAAAGELSESDLLLPPRSYAILGDPGSGKTTTLKRLARKLLREPVDDDDTYQFPIVIRLRELTGSAGSKAPTLMTAIADTLGIRYQTETYRRSVFGRRTGDVERVRVGKDLLIDVLPDVISSVGAVLLVDGLDEAPDLARTLSDLELLTRRLADGKVIFTCRTGDFHRQIEGVHVASLRPLNDQESTAIATAWLGDESAKRFRLELAKLPYRDVADRPLMLCQLLFLYSRNGHLPDQRTAVYRRMVNLLLHDWDAERGIERRSAYAMFLPERKADFLAALSYHLTYRAKARSFTSVELAAAYNAIHEGFRLPTNQANEVARELETHTGIIVASSHDRYEFSHLSLQEYLCADFIVREPEVELLDEYAAQYPAPLAVAVALSSAPGAWFTNLVLKHIGPNFSPTAVVTFLARLNLEMPTFSNSPALGMALLYLMSRYDRSDNSSLHELLSELIVKQRLTGSLRSALEWYIVEPDLTIGSDHVFLSKRFGILERYGIRAPETLRVPKSIVRPLLLDTRSRSTVVWRKNGDILEAVTGNEPFLDFPV